MGFRITTWNGMCAILGIEELIELRNLLVNGIRSACILFSM